MSFLCFRMEFADSRSHGRGDQGVPEWPPSPLRLFQALIAAAASHWNERETLSHAVPALQWLEAQPPPSIVAPKGTISETKCQFYVPDNTGEKAVPAWKKGEKSDYPKRVEKVVQPVHFKDSVLHYLYSLNGEGCPHFEVLRAAARSITHLGWGIDMVVGDTLLLSVEQAETLPGVCWNCVARGGTPLRMPIAGTLADLMRKHSEFLGRVSNDGFRPVTPIKAFRIQHYLAEDQIPARPVVVFDLLTPCAEKRKAFHTARRTWDVAGMLRHLVSQQGGNLGLSESEVASIVQGHALEGGPLRGESADDRLLYLPLPTVNPVLDRIGSIRRVLIAGPPGRDELIRRLRVCLSGQYLTHDVDGVAVPQALLTILPSQDWVARQYLNRSQTWTTVTPVVLPRHHKKDLDEAGRNLVAAIRQAGLPKPVQYQFRSVGFRAGLELATRYCRPTHMNGPMFHVRLRFSQPLPGPIVVGAGRYRGFGLFVGLDSH